MALEWEQVIIDSLDPVALGHWWAEALDWVVVEEGPDECEIRPTPDRTPGLLFGGGRPAKVGKSPLHLDFRPDDQAIEVERFLALGATRAQIGQTGDEPWVVLQDPEGNEFCILSDRRHA